MNRSTRTRIVLGSTLFASTLWAGCNAPTEPAGTVRGKVTIDGQLAEEATISFVPAGQKYPTARGDIVNGRYEEVVPDGDYKVMISAQRVVGETKLHDSSDSPTRKTTEEILPPKYNDQTELQITVDDEHTVYNFDLSSK